MKNIMKRLLLISLSPLLIFAHPKGEKIVSGKCDFHRTSEMLTIKQNSEKAIIHWDDFSIAKDEIAKFIQPSASSAVLNRVTSSMPSQIYGTLQSNGSIFLINQNGILIGPKGQIKTAGFLVSTLDVANEEFLDGKSLTFKSDSTCEIIHKGSIASSDDVFFISRKITDEGNTYSSDGKAYLLAGEEIVLIKENEKTAVKISGIGSIDQKGKIEAISCDLQANGGDIFSLAINQEGVIQANTIEEKNGQIILSADRGIVKVSGNLIGEKAAVHILGEYVQLVESANIDVSSDFQGGTILIGGDYKGENPLIKNANAVFISSDVTINANANINGDGGKVILWGEKLNQFYGNISAKGGKENGNGGFVEVSSHGIFEPNGKIDTSAENGKTGTLLFDPIDLNITNAVNSGINLPIPPPAFPDPYSYTFTGANPANINYLALGYALDVNNIIIDVTGAGAGTGIVTISYPITWSAPTCLKIITPRNIDVTANIRNTYHGSNTFDAIDFQANTAGTTTGTFRGIHLNGSLLTTLNGNISLKATGRDSTATSQGIYIQNSKVASQNGNIFMQGDARIASRRQGLWVDNSTIESSGMGNIHLIGNGGGSFSVFTDRPIGLHLEHLSEINSKAVTGGTITLEGYAKDTAVDNMRGMILEQGKISSVDGAIYIKGIGGGYAASVSNYNDGITMGFGWYNFTIESTGIAPITLEGISGPGGGNVGIYISGVNYEIPPYTNITSSKGAITLIGKSESQFGRNGEGIYIDLQAIIESKETAPINIFAYGAYGDIQNNYSFGLIDGYIRTKDGPINIYAEARDKIGSGSYGANIGGSEITSTGKGNINITGIGAPGSDSNWGIYCGDSIISSIGTGNIYMKGTAKGTSFNNYGIYLSNNSTISTNVGSIFLEGYGSIYGTGTCNGIYKRTNSFINSTSGTVTLKAIAGGTNSHGFYSLGGEFRCISPSAAIDIYGQGRGTGTDIYVDAGKIGSATTVAPITLHCDTILLDPSNYAIETTGNSGLVTILPRTTNQPIYFGDAGLGLDFTDAILGQIKTGTPGLIVGREDGANSIYMQNVSPAINFSSLTVKGKDLTCNDAITLTNVPLTAFIGQTGLGSCYFNNTATFTVASFNLFGIGNQSSNSLFGPNTTNNWHITEDNMGTLSTSAGFVINFINVGSLIGGNLKDTFTFENQKRLEGMVDGTTPAIGNVLIYNNWDPLALVVFNTLYDGWASNIDGGFFNIENIYGVSLDPFRAIKAAATQLSLCYINFNPSKKEDLYIKHQEYLLRKLIDKRNIFWIDIRCNILYDVKMSGMTLEPEQFFEIIQQNFKKNFYGISYNSFYP